MCYRFHATNNWYTYTLKEAQEAGEQARARTYSKRIREREKESLSGRQSGFRAMRSGWERWQRGHSSVTMASTIEPRALPRILMECETQHGGHTHIPFSYITRRAGFEIRDRRRKVPESLLLISLRASFALLCKMYNTLLQISRKMDAFRPILCKFCTEKNYCRCRLVCTW